MSSYKELLKPGRIGKMELRNRLIMPGMSTRINFAGQGYVTERFKDYLEARARGGIGLIIVENASVDGSAWRSEHQTRIDDDEFIPGLRGLAEAVHRHGARIAQQIGHGGRTVGSTVSISFTGTFPPPEAVQAVAIHGPKAFKQMGEGMKTVSSKVAGYQPVAPSPIPAPGGDMPRELTVAEIRDLVELFARAADRTKRAGFDGVEIHACHKDLVKQFLAPSSNQRQDEYGGSWRNRARFLLEIVEATRKAVGPDFPFWCRIDSEETEAVDHIPLAQLLELAQWVEQNGVDAINVTGMPYYRPYFCPPGYFVTAAAAIKQVVRIPVIVAGGITPEMGESMLEQGKADFIGMGRQSIADPQFPNKLAAGQTEDIAPCIRCVLCTSGQWVQNPASCSVNASVGREREYQITPAGRKKRVLVVGGGPAGMEAARVAALRGHDVTLCSKEPRLGGALPILAVLRERQGADLITGLTRYFETQLLKLAVKVRRNTEVDEALIKEITPDVVIVAAGGGPPVDPAIPGINSPIVVGQARLHRMVRRYLGVFRPNVLRWLTRFYLPVGKTVVIMGGAIQGIELADFLTDRGRKVTVTETSDELGDGMAQLTKTMLIQSLTQLGCTLLAGVKYEEITDRGLTITDREGQKRTLDADTILLALPSSPNTGIFESLKGKVPEVYLIGDAREPNLIMGAVSEGFRTALTI
ncbi:MAG: FAD-dependent oxidoreductase [Chloroflexi bacterium]|nr:FAD-dependent oxidoreductase [Chloroflexota bacterium]